MTARKRIVVYGKPGCHLCEIAYDLALGLGDAQELTVEKVDITGDPLLYEKYHEKIPVLVVNERVTLFAPIRTAQLREALSG